MPRKRRCRNLEFLRNLANYQKTIDNLHKLSTAFVLGYHGCSKTVGERLLAGEEFLPSKNSYDWLGPGIYFWEANPRRGLEFFRETSARRRGKRSLEEPYVVGAVVELGLCLDLTTSSGVTMVRDAYDSFNEAMRKKRASLPTNGSDLLRRNLDCAVITWLHEIREADGVPALDSVKGVFVEGAPVYEGSGFREKTHVQICVRRPACIKGVFRVPERDMIEDAL